VENIRYVADGRIVSSAGISAAIPTTLALVEAIAGEAKAAAVARELGVSDWSTMHDSQVFAPAFGRNLMAFATTNAINPGLRQQEAVGVTIYPRVDETSLAILADAYSRTGRSKAFAIAASEQPARTRQGLMFVPDQIIGFQRIIELPQARAGGQMDAALLAVERDYGRLTAFGVALDFEYPGFQ
jgi:hypothetical protein